MRDHLALALAVIALAACGSPGERAEDLGEGSGRERFRVRMGPGMMRQMMANMPIGLAAGELPEPETRGAHLVERYCSQCHGIPSPRRHAAEDWPAILRRMLWRMERMERMGGMGRMMGTATPVEAPAPEEVQAILGYLRKHGMRTTPVVMLPDSESPGARLFARVCSRCHALPDPAQHTPEEWPEVVARMREHMREMDVEESTEQETAMIVRYLVRAAAAASENR